VSQWWKQGKFRLRKRKDEKWELKGAVWQPVLKEEHVLREIVTRLWFTARIKLWRINCPVGGKVQPNTPGIPDLIGYLPLACALGPDGRALSIPLFIEVKRPGGVRRTAQIQFIDEARKAGSAAFFAESWDDVCRELGTFGYKLAN